MNKIGSMLRQARKAKKLSAREVGEKIGISTTFIYDIEKGAKGMKLETIVRLADIYDCPSLVKEYKTINNIPDKSLGLYSLDDWLIEIINADKDKKEDVKRFWLSIK